MLSQTVLMLSQLAFVALTVLAAWVLLVLIGLPFTLACLPRTRIRLTLPLAAVVAVSLITSIHEHLFFSLLQPYRPVVVYTAAIALSCAFLGIALLLRRESLATLAHEFIRGLAQSWPFLVVPFVSAIAFGCLFAVNGLEMLSAGQDELGYVETTRHIANHMFTRDAQDLPWGRHDHYLAEVASRGLAYFPASRLGAFFVLADVSFFSRLSLEISFPLVVGICIVTATASLALLSLLLRWSVIPVIAAQIAFATSWLLMMLHFQGSLSHLLSLSFRLGGLAFILWALAFTRRIGPLLLAAILGAGWLVAYHESIGFGLAMPIAVGLMIACRRAYRGRTALLRNFAFRALVCGVLIYALQSEVVHATIGAHLAFAGSTFVGPAGTDVGTMWMRATVIAGNVLPPILGYHSLYDQTAINLQLAQLLAPHGAILLLGFAAIAALGFWLRLPAGPREGWATMVLALATLAILSAMRQNVLMLVRSAQMVLPHILVGLSLLAFGRRPAAFRARNNKASRPAALTTTGRVMVITLWALAIGSNSFATVRTISFVNGHSQASDPTVRHFNPNTEVWQRLRELVMQSGGDPVLFSGFTNTPIPHMIALGLGDTPHLAGKTISSFWRAVDPQVSTPRDVDSLQRYLHWLSGAELAERLTADPVWDWPTTYERLLARSRFAIVPNSGAYPPEWGGPRRLFGAKAWRFPNLCDVIGRDSAAFLFDTEHALAGRDELGPYWQVNGAVEARPQLSEAESVILEVHYTGPAARLSINGVAENGEVRLEPASRSSVLTARARLDSSSMIMVSTEPQTRLRSIMLYRLPAQRLQDVPRTTESDDSAISEPLNALARRPATIPAQR